MALRYLNLDVTTRSHMLQEFEHGFHYESPQLNERGQTAWLALLSEAIKSQDDAWLEDKLSRGHFFRSEGQRSRNGKIHSYLINKGQAAKMLAEGEFNRFYLRGLCLRSIEEGMPYLKIYRARVSEKPRPESEQKIGKIISSHELLESLRSTDFVNLESMLSVSSGPNSGLCARLLAENEHAEAIQQTKLA